MDNITVILVFVNIFMMYCNVRAFFRLKAIVKWNLEAKDLNTKHHLLNAAQSALNTTNANTNAEIAKQNFAAINVVQQLQKAASQGVFRK